MNNFEYRHLLPAGFDPASRVWIYQSNRLLTLSEALQLEDRLNGFVGNWQSHGSPVKGYANLFFGQFIVLMADDAHDKIGGCSTDSSVRTIKEIESAFNINLFDRQLLAFLVKEKVQMLPLSQFGYALENKFISPDTIYFNNTVQSKAALENNWMIPVGQSWLSARMKQQPAVR
jgi:hypothetical protein